MSNCPSTLRQAVSVVTTETWRGEREIDNSVAKRGELREGEREQQICHSSAFSHNGALISPPFGSTHTQAHTHTHTGVWNVTYVSPTVT
jgi:hypothetical protein